MAQKIDFARTATSVAKDLVGRMLVRKTPTGITAGKILQTGAYEGGRETNSRLGMNYSPGTIFLMPFRGFRLLNIATDKERFPSCVEIREVAYHDKRIKGSGAISNYLDIHQELDGLPLHENWLYILGESVNKNKIICEESSAENCLGYFSLGGK